MSFGQATWPPRANAASERTTACCQPVQPANGRQLVADLLLAFEADRPRVASFPRARLPQSKALVQPSQLRPQAENVSATPSVEIAAALASTMAHRSKLRLVVFARSSASLITRPAGVQIKTLNPKRLVSGRYWGGLKQPPRHAARDPLGRGAPLRGQTLNPKP